MPPKAVKPRLAAAPLVPPPLPEVLSVPVVTLPYPRGAWRSLGYLLAFFQPGMGLLLALLYWPGQENRIRRFSRWCLALALLGWCFANGSDAVRSGVQSGEWFIQPY